MVSIVKHFISAKPVRWFLKKTLKTSAKAIEVISGRAKPNIIGKIYTFFFSLVMRTYMASIGVPWSEVRSVLKDPGIARCFMIVVRSLAEYGLRIPIVLNAPFSVVMNLTNRCNLLCKHCFQKACPDETDHMSRDQKLKIVEEMAELGVAAITFSGGEPLMSDDFWDVVSRASELGIFCSIDTNGTLIDDTMSNKLIEFGIKYAQISIDSPNCDKHDEFRCLKGAFDLSMRGAAAMKKVGIYLSMGVTLTSENVFQIDDFIALAKKHKFNRIVFYHLIPVGRGEMISNLDLTPKSRAEAMEKLANINDQDIDILSETPHFASETSLIKSESQQKLPDSTYFPITAYFNMGPSRRFLRMLSKILGGCPAGRLYCNIQPNGDLTPCMFSPFFPVVANLTKQNFKEAWKAFEILWNRDKIQGFCGSCIHKIECGGCRARAASRGDVNGPDYGCYTQRYFLEEKRGH